MQDAKTPTFEKKIKLILLWCQVTQHLTSSSLKSTLTSMFVTCVTSSTYHWYETYFAKHGTYTLYSTITPILYLVLRKSQGRQVRKNYDNITCSLKQ